jgi:hypothetical protein
MAILAAGHSGITVGDLSQINDTAAQYDMGRVVVDNKGNKFMYVNADATLAAGNAVTMDFTDATDNKNGSIEVIQPTTGTLSNFMGIAVGVITAGNFGWIQVSGWNQVAMTSTTATAGDFLKVANASYAMVNDVAQGTVPSFPEATAFITTSVAGAQPAVGTVYIKGLFADQG